MFGKSTNWSRLVWDLFCQGFVTFYPDFISAPRPNDMQFHPGNIGWEGTTPPATTCPDLHALTHTTKHYQGQRHGQWCRFKSTHSWLSVGPWAFWRREFRLFWWISGISSRLTSARIQCKFSQVKLWSYCIIHDSLEPGGKWARWKKCYFLISEECFHLFVVRM